jgi:hypothetical protein
VGLDAGAVPGHRCYDCFRSPSTHRLHRRTSAPSGVDNNDPFGVVDRVVLTLTPHVLEGSFIERRGEQDDRWCHEIRDGRLYTQQTVVQWVDDHPCVGLDGPALCDRGSGAVPRRRELEGLRCGGLITPTQIADLKGALSEGLYYLPAQFGLSHLGGGMWSSFPCEDDHGWKETPHDGTSVGELSDAGAPIGWGRSSLPGLS